MDNVPLLVSLFTDCTPINTKEMIVIMQDYGEVVCVMGSAANHNNISVFLQADASLAIEPRKFFSLLKKFILRGLFKSNFFFLVYLSNFLYNFSKLY